MTLEFLTSDLLTARHGFFTRKGGASAGIYGGLNCGAGSSDQSDVVRLNRHLVASEMEVEDADLLSLFQHHSADVITVTESWGHERPKADAMVTAQKGIALGILTADCAPILFHDPVAEVIGAAHSGWKGTLAGIGGATLSAMEKLGADRQNISAAIGPTISQKNYEVGEEFLESFLAESPGSMRFFANGKEGKYQFDLPMFILAHLRDEGVKEAEWIGQCTYADEERFYSFRRTTHRNEPDYGRLISVIRL